ncbi:MAG: diaminopimelate epimerase [Sphingobacteriales bacterium]|nr:MAG: diaminopimelate epimerase [Sphingobacteriales bacterium]TAF81461.1 MAG: diaminopimelate epimerase [Sphingobacteriales bacterium]
MATNFTFYKYQGAGNDFVLIDNRNNIFDTHAYNVIAKICDRKFGVGADGLMLLQNTQGYDFEMLYYNADGQPGSMCGNGGRCIVAFAQHLGIIKTETNFLAVDGPHYAKIDEQKHWVSLQMINVDTVSRDGDAYILNTGSPHYVSIVEDVESLNVVEIGKTIRNQASYIQQGINVNFITQKQNHIMLRTYERGVENETLACGTGATAAAIAMAFKNKSIGHNSTPIKVMGGNLNIQFEYDGSLFTQVFLQGPAQMVFTGIYP